MLGTAFSISHRSVNMLRGSVVSRAWIAVRLRMEEIVFLRCAVANILNTQPWTADNGRASRFGLCGKLTAVPNIKFSMVRNVMQEIGLAHVNTLMKLLVS
jgi:hypothetical protein